MKTLIIGAIAAVTALGAVAGSAEARPHGYHHGYGHHYGHFRGPHRFYGHGPRFHGRHHRF